ncbi:MAG: HD domain-containing protein [Lachnospiraceae bacterium]|jgi:putative hydrolase of HD superfamily|nr:HD domain-containing protein [Lachnospiraceae bacterium]
MDQKRFRKQLDFILEIDKEKNILRQTHLSNGGRREDDAEHAWHLAVMTYLLSEYSNRKIDVAKTMLMTLIHDIVEIDAGDTYAYDAEAKKSEKAREKAAADRLFGLLPDDQNEKLRSIWEEFEAYETPEAKFAHVMDNFQPMLLNHSNHGGDWKEHGIRRSQTEKRNEKTPEGSAAIWDYMKKILDENVAAGSLIDG